MPQSAPGGGESAVGEDAHPANEGGEAQPSGGGAPVGKVQRQRCIRAAVGDGDDDDEGEDDADQAFADDRPAAKSVPMRSAAATRFSLSAP